MRVAVLLNCWCYLHSLLPALREYFDILDQRNSMLSYFSAIFGRMSGNSSATLVAVHLYKRVSLCRICVHASMYLWKKCNKNTLDPPIIYLVSPLHVCLMCSRQFHLYTSSVLTYQPAFCLTYGLLVIFRNLLSHELLAKFHISLILNLYKH